MNNIILMGSLCLSLTLMASDKYRLSCFNDDIYTDVGIALLKLDTVLTVRGDNDYVIERGSIQFDIEEWDSYQTAELKTTENYKKYRPRVYEGYVKFPSISPKFFGFVDFLLPKFFLHDNSTEMDGVFIMTSVDDHWGGTVFANCVKNKLK